MPNQTQYNSINHPRQTPDFTQKPHFEWGTINASALLLILLTAIVSYYFGRRKTKRERHNDAYESFHKTLIPTIKILQKEKWTFTPEDFSSFHEGFDGQVTAMFILTDRMRNKKAFSLKWNKYKDWQNQCKKYESCVMLIGLESKRKELLALINELLKAAKKY